MKNKYIQIYLLDSMIKWCKFILKFNYDLYSQNINVISHIMFTFFHLKEFHCCDNKMILFFFLKKNIKIGCHLSRWENPEKDIISSCENNGELGWGKYFQGMFVILKNLFHSCDLLENSKFLSKTKISSRLGE